MKRRLLLLASVTGCALGARTGEVPPVTIRVVEDTIPLFRSQKGATLRAAIRVYNGSDRLLYVERGCGRAALQRQLGTAWQTVWANQNCLLAQVSPKRLAPGDSTTVFAAYWGSTGLSPELAGWPAMDPRVEPGVYRFVVGIGSKVDPSEQRITKWFPEQRRATEPFAIAEVRRP